MHAGALVLGGDSIMAELSYFRPSHGVPAPVGVDPGPGAGTRLFNPDLVHHMVI